MRAITSDFLQFLTTWMKVREDVNLNTLALGMIHQTDVPPPCAEIVGSEEPVSDQQVFDCMVAVS